LHIWFRLDSTIVREDSATNISILSSCPPTPALYVDSAEPQSDLEKQSENTGSSLKPLDNGYRLSNRKFRQLAPLEEKPATDSSLTVDSTKEGFINHAYSNESLFNQASTADSTLPPPLLTTTESRLVPSSTTPQMRPRTTAENLRQMFSVIGELLRNTRYVCVIIASLVEGVLIKGKSFILLYVTNSS
jgi:hypothetical protein